ncbi:hypothetical protein BDN67DRAFT_961374 [Paxillus ammoniavirescens]|nr:hypothetical protein BDN67DRAFT_961374 [Paxillus ammoniavirescens]
METTNNLPSTRPPSTNHGVTDPQVAPTSTNSTPDASLLTNDTPSGEGILLRRPAITTFVFLAAFLIPFALVPYVLTRRRMSCLSHQLDQLVANNAVLQKNVSTSTYQAVLRKEELSRAISLLESSKKDIQLLRRDISHVQARHEAFQVATRTELQSLLAERKLSRECFDLLPQLGLSLADLAAFMHEVELHQGLPSSATNDRGIEKLRSLALKLQITSARHEPYS